jgi:hypothetical protein
MDHKELGTDCLDQASSSVTNRNLVKRLERFGHPLASTHRTPARPNGRRMNADAFRGSDSRHPWPAPWAMFDENAASGSPDGDPGRGSVKAAYQSSPSTGSTCGSSASARPSRFTLRGGIARDVAAIAALS